MVDPDLALSCQAVIPPIGRADDDVAIAIAIDVAGRAHRIAIAGVKLLPAARQAWVATHAGGRTVIDPGPTFACDIVLPMGAPTMMSL